MTDIAKVAIQADTTGLKKGETALKNFKKVGDSTEKSIIRNTAGMNAGFKSVTPSIKATSSAAVDATPKMQGFGHQARMVSMQLSQVAQQGSVTGNYLQALAIQLPDLMLGFGALGIVIGAVAGSLASYFVNSARDAENASGDLLDEIYNLTDGYKTLTEAQRELLKLDLSPKIDEEIKKRDDALKSVQNYAKWIDIVKGNLEKAIPATDKWGDAVSNETHQKRLGKLRKNIDDMTESMQRQQAAADTAQQKIDHYNKTIADPSGDIAADRNKRYADSINQVAQAESDALAVIQGLETPAERAKREMAEQKSILANAYSENIIDFQAYKEAKKRIDEDYTAGDIARTKAAERSKMQVMTANQTAALGIMGGLFGQMAEIARQGGEEQFQEYKNFASAQAAVSTALAMTNALAVTPTPVGVALATAVGAMGAAQIAMIQGQEYQGARAMGGQVESNGRYLVGENGPEVLQLGSQGGSITPNHALESGGASVTTVVNIQAGVTKQEVASLIPTIVSASTNAVKAELNKGGSMSRSARLRA